MSALDDLIKKIPDKTLQQNISAEIANLNAQKNFGLVFEHHQDITLTDKNFFPYLAPVDKISRGKNNFSHALIEAENFHALRLLQYICPAQVDCIYIDPPYNTGAKDWKYLDSFVDSSDAFRHSKWLSMMDHRLRLAKNLLSDSGVIFISIDDNEQAHLKLLCDEIFGENNFLANFCVKRSGGRQDSKFFAITNEYLICYAKNINFFVAGEDVKTNSNYPKFDTEKNKNYKTQLLRKWGSNSRRIDRPNLFYSIPAPDGSELFPMLSETEEGCWRWGKNKMQQALDENLIEFVQKNNSWIAYEKIYQPDVEETKKFTTWVDDNFSSGAEMIKKIFAENVFSYPKSVDFIKKILRMATNKNSLVLDFFAGSGTTLHAVNLLNAEDGGERRCILVTNNEVSAEEERKLNAAGHFRGDEEFEKFGVARYVAWRRTVCSILGKNVHGEELSGKYSGSERLMSAGFEASAEFFKLDFLARNEIALGKAFAKILPMLWLKSGGFGECPGVDEKNLPRMMVLPENKFAVLLHESKFAEFAEQLKKFPAIETVFLVTDSESAFRAMNKKLQVAKTYQLYKNYLESFRGGENYEI